MNLPAVFEDWKHYTPEQRRAKILNLEDACSKAVGILEPIQCKLREWFVNGVYIREITMPMGAVIIGKIHKTEHISIVSAGSAVVATDAGLEIITAPHTFINNIGAKRCLYILEDMVWTTVHPTDKTTTEEVEKDIIAPDFNSIGLEVDNELGSKRICSSSSSCSR